ncbi:MAG: hypothetical protein OEW19_02240, partial [Acidobacteriota bacterium]|nr:hypothetical protein [Acidobacteriota bacterium]
MTWSRTALLTIAGGMLLSHAVWAEDLVRSIAWQELAAAQRLKSGTVVAAPSGTAAPVLRVVHEGTTPATLPLVTIERPGITSARYALRGRVRYEGVAAGSYLEMWSRLPDGAFFSRTLATSGPMGRLDGSSEWRTFVLPFANREGGAPPKSLDFNLV